MNKKHFNQLVFVTLSILVIAMLSVGGAASSDPPAVPAAYYGEINLNSDQAPADIVIEAEIDDEVRGSVVADNGSFGGPDPRDTKLVVNGSASDDGSKVIFYASGSNFDRTELNQTVTWKSGAVERVDLSGEIDTEASNENGNEQNDGNGGGSGGGGGGSGGDTESEEDVEDIDGEEGVEDTDSEEGVEDTDSEEGVEDTDSEEGVEDTDSQESSNKDTNGSVSGFDLGITLVAILSVAVISGYGRID